MTIENIIKRFELYLDDTSELSSQEELELAQRIYNNIINQCAWEILKKEASGTASGLYIDLPSDFACLCESANYTENTQEYQNNSSPRLIYIDDKKYTIVNWSDRRQYENSGNHCYLDIANSKIMFFKSVSGAYSFDYISNPTDLITTSEWVFPDRFSACLFHGMCVDGYIIQQFDKARSYAIENQVKYESILEDMKIWNASLLNN